MTSTSAAKQHGSRRLTVDASAIEQDLSKDKKDIVATIGRIASVLSVIMYVSYVTQIMNNLSGHVGSPWQPLAAFFNCSMWTAYGLLKPKKDWPIVIANIPGIILGFATFITAII